MRNVRRSPRAVNRHGRAGTCSCVSAFVLLAISSAVCPVQVAAEESATGPQEPRRKLGEHVFIPREAVNDPFTTSFVGSETSLGYGTAHGPSFDLNGNTINLSDYKLAAYSQVFTGQWGISDWWALRLKVNGLVYSGVNGSAAAGVGLNGVARYGAGTTFSFRPAPTVRLGFLFDASFGPSIGLNILQAIIRSLQAGSVVTPVQSTSNTTLSPALSVAWAIARGLGLLGNVGYTHSSISADAANVGADVLGFSAGLDLDLRELGSIPMGFALSYAAGYSVGDTRFRNYRLAGGIFYTGRTELTLGLEFGFNRAPLGAHDVFVSSLLGLIVLRYNFD